MENFKRTEDGKGVVLPDVDLELYPEASTAYGAKVKLDKEGRVTSVAVPKGRVLPFDKPGRRLESKRLITIKGMKPDGQVVQIPLEGQINNQAASPQDFVGIRSHLRRGYTLFFDFETGRSAFCKSWGCWAEGQMELGDYCTPAHRAVTSPEESAGTFGTDATGSGSIRQL